ncbi:toll/interleukin-1 receptor domain-containing protein [Plantactinospora sp. WMMB782]|uniref:toll/interleukin-1 receptor domain-containing protein n=1 Tax=Plantactinospora sp. WMMB782 TaxID=3404121 RepID=UPI003B932BCF
MTGIFINYRTGDETFAAPVIDERLRREFGDDRVFRDSRSLGPGLDFPPEIWYQLKRSTVLLALIGPRWLTLEDDSGNRRIDHPKDYVRREIRRALKRDIRVIPLLLDGGRMPTEEELPHDIRRLARRQFLPLRTRDLLVDLQRLVDELARIVPRSGQSPESRTASAADPATGPGSPANGRHSAVHITGDGQVFNGPITGGDSHG